jgi:hypothetical protein
MCVWRCDMFVEVGYSSVDLDDGVSNLLQRPQTTVSTSVVATKAYFSACEAVHFGRSVCS